MYTLLCMQPPQTWTTYKTHTPRIDFTYIKNTTEKMFKYLCLPVNERPESSMMTSKFPLGFGSKTLQNVFKLYLVCQFSEVLLRVPDHVSHSEDGAVGVVDHVKVTIFNVITSDSRKEVPSAHKHIIMSDLSITVVIIIICKIILIILGVVEDWEADAILNEDGEIFHFHHGCTEKEKRQGGKTEGEKRQRDNTIFSLLMMVRLS